MPVNNAPIPIANGAARLLFRSSIDFASPFIGWQAASDNLFSRIDPRAKLIALFSFILVSAITLSIIPYLMLSMVLAAALCFCRPCLKTLLMSLRPFLILSLLTVILHLFFSSGAGAVIIDGGSFKITESGLSKGLLYGWRVLLISMVTMLFVFTTDPLGFADGLMRLLGPLRRLGLHLDSLGLTFFLIFRFIPLLAEEWQAILAAMISRGYRPRGGPIRRIRESIPVFTAVLTSAMRRAGRFALALTARGFAPGRQRSSLSELRLRRADIILMATAITILAIALVFDLHA